MRRTVNDEFTFGETVANAVSSGVAAVLAIAAIVILVVRAVMHGSGFHLLSAIAFSVPLFLGFLMSTLYNAIPSRTAKRVFDALNFGFGYFTIAGVMTPYCLLVIPDHGGVPILIAAWVLALAATLVESIWLSRPRWLSIVLIGCIYLLFIPLLLALYQALESAAWWLTVAGIACFMLRIVFVSLDRFPYLTFVSHLVALAGGVCLFLAVALFII